MPRAAFKDIIFNVVIIDSLRDQFRNVFNPAEIGVVFVF
jgi:hypothetical protein